MIYHKKNLKNSGRSTQAADSWQDTYQNENMILLSNNNNKSSP